ncbi:lasso RiPP family leader peptide-containing protein [Kineococcus aurantiacus]|uniref:Lasso RiPP family leader peptide-containing protein n=1 Tax=Kineococcus aurantiacus TaxID=37633 RepID=A0A7Y9ATP1_9ACTN|nr:lasso RiPP family leader peptide-containing protein [Kineococcus aurantiacus]NYD21541.1 hypothetical protein [Kineococcus aurantiacus]
MTPWLSTAAPPIEDADALEVPVAEHYSAPRLTTLGSLAELTLRNKKFGTKSDGDFFCEDDGSTPLYTVS